MDITTLITTVIKSVGLVLTLMLLPILRASIDKRKYDTLLFWVKIAVGAAEQMYDASAGRAKKLFVLNFLKEKGYQVDERGIDEAIESAVLDLHNAIGR